MTLEWLLRALATGALLGIAALAAERIAAWFRLPRRWIWAAVMAGALLLPALALTAPAALPEIGLPRWVAMPAAGGAAVVPPGDASPAAPPDVRAWMLDVASRRLPGTVYLGWLAASLAILACIGWSCRRLDAMRNGCVAARVEGARVLVSDHAGPMVLGVMHPELLLPRWVLDAPVEERRLIIRHEREHVAGLDPGLLTAAAVAVALMPWNPVLWVLHRRLRLAVETDCDARVLAAGADRRLYGRLLLRTATRPFSFLPALAPAWGGGVSHLERRIVAMTATPPARRLLRALPLSVLAVGVAAAACDLSSEGATATGERTRVDTHGGREIATREFSDGLGIAIARHEPDSAVGYTGLTPYFLERRHEVRNGERVLRRVRSHPVVVGVDAGSPAEGAGFRAGDVLLSVNGRDSREPPTQRLRPGTEVRYRVRRDGRELQLRLVAAQEPAQAWPPAELDFRAVHDQARLVERLRP
jgi:hypothetical protein